MNFTQIGSLPFDNIKQALDYSYQHSVPFVPDLPSINRSEFMLEQAIQSETQPYQQLALEAFLNNSREIDFQIWKNQLPGPCIISSHLDWSWQRSCEVFMRMLDHRIESFLTFNDQKKIWIFIDEPNLAASSLDRVQAFWDLLANYHSEQVFLCVHYCGAKSLDLVNWDKRVGLSYDSHLHPRLLQSTQFSEITKLVGGHWRQLDQKINNKSCLGITPTCGLWGEVDPEGVLLALKERSVRVHRPNWP